uniref:Carbon monoxide dehydrogenase, small subunit n=1 Tax=uncultured organism TaxID=155900 RepID=M1Q1P9_9ZZZZ|nr:carbon monoxide dehydrogenase, small subunit [uncultured organism]
MTKKEVSFEINGEKHTKEVEPNKTLADFIRKDLGLKGTKTSCNKGDCGTCTVLIDGEPTKSCLVLAPEIEGKEITTIEGLQDNKGLNPVQEAFVDNAAAQCGFCSPAFILTAHAFLQRNPDPTREEIKQAIDGILCRCTGYKQIIDAIEQAAQHYPK